MTVTGQPGRASPTMRQAAIPILLAQIPVPIPNAVAYGLKVKKKK